MWGRLVSIVSVSLLAVGIILMLRLLLLMMRQLRLVVRVGMLMLRIVTSRSIGGSRRGHGGIRTAGRGVCWRIR